MRLRLNNCFENSMQPLIRIAGLPVLALMASCSSIEPWVKPYERDRLSDPIMQFDAAPVSAAYMHHVYQAREGARGAEGGTGGGCGCN